MALENTLINIGDSLTFKTDILSGAPSINGFVDSVSGEIAERYFIKQFRYTTDMVNWSPDWIELTDPNLQAINLDSTYDWQIEYKYSRGGIDATGSITFQWVTLQYAVDAEDYPWAACGPIFNNSVFKYFFDSCGDQQILRWCANVLEKVYQPGIVSKTLIRGKNENSLEEDRDYVDLWRTTTCFFATEVAYGRKFASFDLDQRLLHRYLEVKGLYLDRSQSITTMGYLMTNIINQIARRGTLGIIQDETINTGQGEEQVFGELRRLINYDTSCDEFLFAPNNANTVGWVVNVNSPLYKHIHSNPWLVKLFNSTHVLTDVPLIQSASVSLVTFDGHDDVFKIENVLGDEWAGIGLTTFDADFTTKVHSAYPYEMTFWAQGDAPLTATIKGFNSTLNPANPISVADGSEPPDVTAINRQKLAQTDEWYFIRVIMYPYNQAIIDDPAMMQTNIKVGHNLRASQNICHCGVEILFDRRGSGVTLIEHGDVKDVQITIDLFETYTLGESDLLEGYLGISPSSSVQLSITGVTGPGNLLLDNVIVVGFPQTVTLTELYEGKLQFEDLGIPTTAKTITISYIVYDVIQPGTDGDILYIRDIEFKPLSTTYGKAIVGSPLLVETWLENKSELSQADIEETTRRYLVPHEVGVLNNFLEHTKI
jgi:hypothetical protein